MNQQYEQDGGNIYIPHKLQITSGQFWRCTHGNTGFDNDMRWVGCEQCALANPKAFKKLRRYPNDPQ